METKDLFVKISDIHKVYTTKQEDFQSNLAEAPNIILQCIHMIRM